MAVADPNVLLRHLEACGESARAAKQAEQAARLAAEGLAFERAAELYATALRLGSYAGDEARKLRLARAEALAKAERGPGRPAIWNWARARTRAPARAPAPALARTS